MIKAIILDLDDTLCLTEEASFNMENEALAAMGRQLMSRNIHKSTWGRPLFEAIVDRSPGIDVEVFRKSYEPVIKRYVIDGRLDAIPEANINALKSLATAGKSLVVLTSRTHTELEHMLEPAHMLSGHVTAFYYRDNMKFHKPDPRAFAHIEHNHGWLPNQCIYVGDSLSDASAAKGAGLFFIASLESGLRTKEDFANHSVDVFINKFPEVVEAVKLIESKL